MSEPARSARLQRMPSAASWPEGWSRADDALVELGTELLHRGYRFTTVTPATHARVNARREARPSPASLTDVLGCSTPSLAYSAGWPLRSTEGRREFLAVVDYNDTGLYERDRVTIFSPFGGFPVYSHDYDRLDEPPRMEAVRTVTEEMLKFSRKPQPAARPPAP